MKESINSIVMDKETPIIFLDIDGVLNCQDHYDEVDMSNRAEIYPLGEISKSRVELVNLICNKTNAVVVISSSWRHGSTVEELQLMFNQLGATFIIDSFTKDLWSDFYVRGNEIKLWLKENRHYTFNAYAIIDDDSDMLLQQKDNFFQTEMFHGLTKEIANNIINWLNNNVKIKDNA